MSLHTAQRGARWAARASVRYALRTRGDKAVTLSADEFLRRFLLHVLPRGFVKIRHYGLMAASHATTTLEVARERIATAAIASTPPTQDDTTTDDARVEARDWRARLEALTGIDLSACPRCGLHTIQRLPLASVPNTVTHAASAPPDTS
jgi:hypothetical protein